MDGTYDNASLELLLRTLRLPAMLGHYEEAALRAARQGWSFGQYLREMAHIEVVDQQQRRIRRLLKRSALPLEKTLATLDVKRLPAPVQRQLPVLCEGTWVERGENLLAFGLPGRGKTHLVCAIARELVGRGTSVLFVPAYKLVQRLLAAKRELTLEGELRRLDRFALVCVDDIGYVQQDREEMEVLFTFLAERYERRSVAITSNLVFSQWDRIFKDAMTTAAAIDRLVHHATILELTGDSYRSETAKQRRHGGHAGSVTPQPAAIDQ